ncbi:MAG TPA: protein kinase [Polyangiaceae bacterium]
MIPKYAPGEKIPGTPYVVAYTIGRGGGGHVLAVRDEHLDVLRAIKLLEVEPRPGEKPEEAKKALLKEAVVIAKLHKLCKEHIVEVLFVGQTADQHSVPYIVMELIDGAPLRDLLKRRGGRLEPQHARQVGIDVLAALSAAHDQGIVHRDLKPANIMCEVLDQQRVRMKVIDFGIVGGVNQRTKRIAGTFRYAAPEQIHISGPSPLMAQTDIYSLGCILYECIAGQGPFDSFCKTNEHFVHAHLTAEPPPISQFVPEIPREFDVFFASMLSKDPHRRPSSARACAAQLIDLPWGRKHDLDTTHTQEMLPAAVQSVVRNHEERRGPPPAAVAPPPTARPAGAPTLGATIVDPPRTFGSTMQSPGVEPPPATLLAGQGKGGTMRVSQLPYAPTEGPEPTRTSAPMPPPANLNGTEPTSDDGRRGNFGAPYWQQPPLDPDMQRDPSTFGAVAQTYRISPQARWVAIAAVGFSAAVLLVAFGVWLARRTAIDPAATTAATASVQPVAVSSAAAPTTPEGVPSASAAPAIDPVATAAPTTSATTAPLAPTGAPTTTATPTTAAAAPTTTAAPTATHHASTSTHADTSRSQDSANSAGSATKPRKLPGSGL